jgi:hypothetical protein
MISPYLLPDLFFSILSLTVTSCYSKRIKYTSPCTRCVLLTDSTSLKFLVFYRPLRIFLYCFICRSSRLLLCRRILGRNPKLFEVCIDSHSCWETTLATSCLHFSPKFIVFRTCFVLLKIKPKNIDTDGRKKAGNGVV